MHASLLLESRIPVACSAESALVFSELGTQAGRPDVSALERTICLTFCWAKGLLLPGVLPSHESSASFWSSRLLGKHCGLRLRLVSVVDASSKDFM